MNIQQLISNSTKLPFCKSTQALEPAITRTLEGKIKLATELQGDSFRKIPKTFKTIREVKLSDIFPVKKDNHTYYRYTDSIPLQNFSTVKNKIKGVKGLSTHPYSGGVYLRGNYDTPLGTSGVGNCALVCLYNSKKCTHAIYHAAPVHHNPVSIMKDDMQLVMPEGFDKAIIVPGCDPDTANTVKNLFEASKQINENAVVNFMHSENTGLVEFISYKGNTYDTVLENGIPLFPIQNPYEYETMLRVLQGGKNL